MSSARRKSDAEPLVLLSMTAGSRLGVLARRLSAIVTDEVLGVVVQLEPRMRFAHLRVLAALEGGPARASTVAERLGTTKQTVGPVVAELVEWGVLIRIPDPTDRRAKLLHFTEEGLRIGRCALGAAQALEQRWRSAVGPDELDRCKRTLWRLIDAQRLEFAYAAPPRPDVVIVDVRPEDSHVV